MEFIPSIHTKDFLLSNESDLLELAKKNREFAESELAQDIDILKKNLCKESKIVTVAHILAENWPIWSDTKATQNTAILKLDDEFGWTVAHALAEHQQSWVKSPIASSKEVLMFTDIYDYSVAHVLAVYQPCWLSTKECEDFEVLSLADEDGVTVAHNLAKHQKDWINNASSKKIEVLKIKDILDKLVVSILAGCNPEWIYTETAKDIEVLKMGGDWSVANTLIDHNQHASSHEALFHKEILTLSRDNKLLAERMVEKFGATTGLTISDIALRLVSQGAAYKNSIPMSVSVGKDIYNRGMELITDSLEPVIALKHAQALYSTCYYAAKQASTSGAGQEWMEILALTENEIIRLLAESPELERNIKTDILCEPSTIFINHFLSNKNIQGCLSSLGELESSQQTPQIEASAEAKRDISL